MARLLSLLICLLFFCTGAFAASEADGNGSIASGAHTINLGASYSHVTVTLSSASSTVNITVNHGATASSSNYLLGSGLQIQFGQDGRMAPTDQINYFGNGTTGSISWAAW